MKNQSSHTGFTLIELLVVIAIIGLLASVVLSSMSNARTSAQDSKRKLEVNSMKNSLQVYYNANGSYPREGWCDSSIGSHSGACPPAAPTGEWNQTSLFYQDFVITGGLALPIDPVNDSVHYYSYEPTNDGRQGYYFRARLSDGSWWAACAGSFEDGASWCN